MIASQERWSRFLSSFLTAGSNYKGSLWDLFRGLRKMVIRSNPRIIRLGFRSETPEATRIRLWWAFETLPSSPSDQQTGAILFKVQV